MRRDSTPPSEVDFDFGAALDEFEVSDTPVDGFWLENVGFKLGEIPQAVLQAELDQSEDVIVPSPGIAGVVEMLGADLPNRVKWRDPAWLRALYELSSRGVEFAAFQEWAARGVAAEESKAVGTDCPPDSGFIVKERIEGGRWKPESASEEFSFPPPPPGSPETGVDVGGKSEAESTLEVVTAVSLSKDAPKKLWHVAGMRALAPKREEP